MRGLIRERKIEEGETVRRYLERMLLRIVKRWYFRQFPELKGKFKADRGKKIEAKMERIVGGLGVRKKDVKEALNRVGLVIYTKKGALENPGLILFVSNVGKYSTVYDADNALSLFQQLYPTLRGNFASVEQKTEEELRAENFEHLDHVVVEQDELKVLEKLSSVLQEYFGVNAKPELKWQF